MNSSDSFAGIFTQVNLHNLQATLFPDHFLRQLGVFCVKDLILQVYGRDMTFASCFVSL